MGEPYLLIKRGYYWRPNSMGYTGLRAEAGLYTEAEANARCANPDVTMVPFSVAPEFSAACARDVIERYRKSTE